MDINGISSSLNATSLLSLKPHAAESEPAELKNLNESHRGARGKRGLALGILQSEMRIALKAKFHARFNISPAAYAPVPSSISPDDVASEALGTARQIADAAPTSAAKALIRFRASVHESASIAHQTVGGSDDAADIDDAVASVDAGLDELEQEVAANRESSASVLAIDSRTRQRSTIRIRTQEGDIVRLDLKQVDRLSANDFAITNNEGSASVTEIAASSSSRLKFHVNGDLNESELEAIQNVLTQAEAMADEFFGGDIGAAFNAAQGFEFDSEQLARVNLRFRMQQTTNIAYAERVSAPAEAPVPAIASEPPVAAVAPASTVEAPSPTEPESAKVTDADTVPEPPAEIDSSALTGFFDLVSDFLRSLGDGFDARGDNSIRLHYAESFKLELLRTVVATSAPDNAMVAADNADAAIESLIDAAPADSDLD